MQSIAVFALTLSAMTAGVSTSPKDANEYRNPTVGFAVTKPAAWQFATAQQNLENLKRVELKDKELQEAMVKSASAPLVVMMKFPEPHPDLNPSFKANIKPLGQLKGKDPKEIVALLLPGLQRAYSDLKVVQPPMDVTVSGLKGAYARVTYSLVVPGTGSFPTVSELWIVPRGDYFFMLGAGSPDDGKPGARGEIQNIVQSIRIEP